MNKLYRGALLLLSTILTPSIVFAQTISQIAGLFNIFVGLMLAAAILSFALGFVIYIVRLGTIQREKGIEVMSEGTTILFVLVVLLAIVQYFQRNPAAGAIVVAFVVVALVIWGIVVLSAGDAESEDAKH